MTSLSIQSIDYKPQFSGHDSFPLRHGWLEKAYAAVSNSAHGRSKIFSEDESIAHFGVGRNMVTAIRFWAHSFGIVQTSGKEVFPTGLGDVLFAPDGLDPYLESHSALWLLHWKLASSPKHTLTYWLFNYFAEPAFDRELLTTRLKTFADQSGWTHPASKTLTTDISVLIANYALLSSRPKSQFSDDALASPMADLGLLREVEKGRFSLNLSPKPTLRDEIFVFALCEFWNALGQQETMSLQTLLLEPGSPGRVFLLDEAELSTRLEEVDRITNGRISWSETAGLRQLIRRGPFERKWTMDVLSKGFG